MPRSSTFYSCVVFIIVLCLALFGVYLINAAEHRDQQLLLEDIVQAQAGAIERRLSRSLSATYILAQEVRRSDGNFKDFDKFADSLTEIIEFIRVANPQPIEIEEDENKHRVNNEAHKEVPVEKEKDFTNVEFEDLGEESA